MKNLAKFNKFWIALGAAAGVLVLACAPDAATNQAAFQVTTTEWYQVLVAFAASFGVFQVANRSGK